MLNALANFLGFFWPIERSVDEALDQWIDETQREPECPFCGAKGVNAYDCTICFGEYAK